MDEHVLQNDCNLQLSSSTLEGNFNYAPHLADNTLFQHITKAEDYDSYSVPQWTEYQQMAPYYVEYLVGNGISDMQGQGEIPYDSAGIGCSYTSEESFLSMDAQQLTDSRRQHEEILVNDFRNTQHQTGYQKQGPEQGLDTAAQNQPNKSALTSGITKSRKTCLRQKATDADRRRRTRIATALDALEDLLPQSKEGNKTNIVDDCIDYIKFLQLHMKELSQNRLVGEPTCNHLTYVEVEQGLVVGAKDENALVNVIIKISPRLSCVTKGGLMKQLQGYGHYLVNENSASGPLQEMLGNLMDTNPSAAIKLLESSGLYMMPIPPNN